MLIPVKFYRKIVKESQLQEVGTYQDLQLFQKKSFDSSVYTIVRLRYPNLRSLKTFSREYLDEVVGIQQSIEEKLSDNGTVRLMI